MTDEPLNQQNTEALLARKDELVARLANLLGRLGLQPDYAWNVMTEARRANLPAVDHITLLEGLMEIEAIKYTLAARIIREMEAEAGPTPDQG